MQTFLPYPDFEKTAKCLDFRRLGKQRVEAYQIYRVLTGKTDAWKHHPAVLMWKGYEDALAVYHNIMISEWVQRGYRNNMSLIIPSKNYRLPYWLGGEIHSSHRARLLAKNEEHYKQFGWSEKPGLNYYWPKSNLR